MSSKKTIKRERDDLAERLSSLLCDLTDGLLSKTNYDVPTMVSTVEATFEKYADEARADAWDEAAEATPEWMANNPSPAGVPIDPPRNPYRAAEENP